VGTAPLFLYPFQKTTFSNKVREGRFYITGKLNKNLNIKNKYRSLFSFLWQNYRETKVLNKKKA
jgi:hypothetical protein